MKLLKYSLLKWKKNKCCSNFNSIADMNDNIQNYGQQIDVLSFLLHDTWKYDDYTRINVIYHKN